MIRYLFSFSFRSVFGQEPCVIRHFFVPILMIIELFHVSAPRTLADK